MADTTKTLATSLPWRAILISTRSDTSLLALAASALARMGNVDPEFKDTEGDSREHGGVTEDVHHIWQ